MKKKIRLCEPDISRLEIKYVTEVIQKNLVSSNSLPVRKFEEVFAKRFGVRNAVAVNSGGSALFLALKALGIDRGDEVIVPTFTMFATASAVSHCGATPVFVDSEKWSPNIDSARIEEKITARTRAITVAHLFGIPCEMDPILEIAEKHNLYVVEDAAEAHGALYKGKLVGTFGNAGCFSLYASKIMTSGEGGVVITDDDRLAELVCRLREYDIDHSREYIHELMAWNMRMSALEAALGSAQLERLKELIEKRNKVTVHYREQLKSIPEIQFLKAPTDTSPVTWLYTVLAQRRDRLAEALKNAGVESKVVFVPLHRQPVYNQKGDFPNAERFSREGLSLPSASTLSRKDQDYVIEKIKEFYGR